jgi:dephospho-CoA kinase
LAGKACNGRDDLRVFAVVGRNGSGKDEVVEYLQEKYGIPKTSVGDRVREIAEQEGKKPTRENLQEIAERYRARYGRDYFIKKIIRHMEERGWKTAGITGIRTVADVSALKRKYGEDLVLVHVRVDHPKIRFQRLRKRGEARDPQTYEEFLDQDRREEEIFHLSDSIEQADVTIPNNGTLEQFHQEIEKNMGTLLNN